MQRQVLIVTEEAAPLWVGQALSPFGLVPVYQADPGRALWRAAREQPALIVLHDLPGAASLCRTLKLHRPTNLIPLLQTTSPPATGGGGLLIEPDEWLTPPLSRERFATALQRLLRRRDERDRDGMRAELRFAVPSDAPALEELSVLLAAWFASCGLSPYQVQQLNLAVREVVANAIEWGHGYVADRLVAVACRLESDRVGILVRDTGPGFDPRDLPHAARPGDPLSHLPVRAARKLREGGFGILMASGLVDHLCYNDTGNEASLIKLLPTRRSPAASSTTTTSGSIESRSAPVQP